MGFLEWLRSRGEKKRAREESRREEIERRLDQIALQFRTANVPFLDWETTINRSDILSLTGVAHPIHTFIRHSTEYGSIRLRVARRGRLVPDGTTITHYVALFSLVSALGCCSTDAFESGYKEGRREALIDALEESVRCADRADVEIRLNRLVQRAHR